MPKKPVTGKRRGPYGPACNICSQRKSKCDGEPGSVCAPCRNSGRSGMCTWDAYYARRTRGETMVSDPPKQTEAFHRLLIEYHGYACKLEGLLDDCIRTYPALHGRDFRSERPKDPDDLLGLSLSFGEFHLDREDDNSVECDDDSENPTNILLWHDLSTLVEGHYGLSSPFRFKSEPLPVPSRFPAIAEDPGAMYVLLVGNDTNYNPHFDWSRYLPMDVALDRASHDKALDVLFRYCISYCLRIIPDLFLKDMYRVLSVPPSQEPPKTAHYSPMLHNALVALALAFSDDSRFRDLKARLYFVNAAKACMEAECQKPTLASVQALSFLGTFYGSQGEQGLGFMYFGLSARVAQALGLNLDCSDYVERGLMDYSDKVDRNWATWSIFTSDVCWSLYVGREFATSVPDDDFPLPYIDAALDEMPVVYGNLPPQPNHTTKTFHANAELFVIGRDILEVNNSLSKTKARPIVVFDRVDYVDTKLNDWCASLPLDLQLSVKARSTPTPHLLLLHLSYWWLFVLLHRPLFHYRTSMKAGRQIDHIKLCKRAADGIMDILKTWQELFGLRFCPITLIQIAFSAGTIYLLLAVQACSGEHVVKEELDHAIAQQNLVADYLHEIGKSWPGANKIAEILKDLVDKKLTPLLEKLPARIDDGQVASPDIKDERVTSPSVPRSPSQDRGAPQLGQKVSPKNKRKSSQSGYWRGSSGGQPIQMLPQQPPFALPPISPVTSSSPPDRPIFQPPYSPTSAIPPQKPTYTSTQGYVEQPDFNSPQLLPSTWSSLYPNTGFHGMPQGQTIPQAPFWNQINIDEATFFNSLEEFIAGQPATFIRATTGGSVDHANAEMVMGDVNDRNDWFSVNR